jgi:predicted esterase YcpF (UPF0227 family)
MKRLIVYFHGYGSSKDSDKVTRLKRESDFIVHAFDININADVAYNELTQNIDMMLATDVEQPVKLVFVGTSLGGWWASRMAKLYQCKAVVINPSIDPENSLLKYGVPYEVCERYHLFAPFIGHKYFFARYDEVIDSRQFRDNLSHSGHDVTVIDKADHRFNGEPFEEVIKYLKGL